MEKIFSKIENLTLHMREYAEISISLIKIKAAEKASSLIADAAALIIVWVFLFFFIFFISFGGAYVLSSVLGSAYSGYLIVGAFYLLVGVIVWFARKKLIRNPVLNAMVRNLFENNNENGKH